MLSPINVQFHHRLSQKKNILLVSYSIGKSQLDRSSLSHCCLYQVAECGSETLTADMAASQSQRSTHSLRQSESLVSLSTLYLSNDLSSVSCYIIKSKDL